MNNIIITLSILGLLVLLTGCETTQQKDEVNIEVVYIPAVQICTKIPLMADLTKSYKNRVYIEDGQQCTKSRGEL